MTFRTCLISTLRVLLTLSLVVLAIFSGNWLWQHYELAPWTRDGRVKANIIQIAPDITGQVTALPIHDNVGFDSATIISKSKKVSCCLKSTAPVMNWQYGKRKPS